MAQQQALETSSKRKRGRPLKASSSTTQPTVGAQQPAERDAEEPHRNDADADADESTRPRKRGRTAQTEKPNGVIPTTRPATVAEEPGARASRRGRPATVHRAEGAVDGGEASYGVSKEGAAKGKAGRTARGEGSGETGPPKRRGRPAAVNASFGGEGAGNGAQQDAEAATKNGRRTRDANEQTAGDDVNQARPRRRGRPAQKDNAINGADADPAHEVEGAWRTRRAVGGDAPDPTEGIAQEPETGPPQRRKRGRAAAQDQELEPANDATSVPLGRQRKGRKPKEPQPNLPTVTEEEPSRPGRMRRERSLREVVNPPNVQGNTADVAGPKKRRRQREQPPQDADENDTTTTNNNTHPNTAPKTKASKQKQPRTNPSQSSAQPSSETTAAAVPKQKEPRPSPRPYRYLEEHVRYVPCTIINNEWDPLKPSSLASVQELLSTAERTVLENAKDTHHQRDRVAAALGAASRRLMRQIRQVPFPPAVAIPPGLRKLGRPARPASSNDDDNDDDDDGRDAGRGDELRFERVLDAAEGLEQRIDPLRHAIKVLESEKKTLAADIERQRRKLEQLTTAAKGDSAFWRERLQHAHRLAPYPRAPEGDEDVVDANDDDYDEGDELARVPAFTTADAVGTLYQDLQEDDELRGLAGQLVSHVESMRANARQIDGVVPGIAKSSAALRMALLKNLDQKQFERVLFGES